MRKFSVGLTIAAIAMLLSWQSETASAAAIDSRYTLTRVLDQIPGSSQLGIDDEGEIRAYSRASYAPYTIKTIYDPDHQGRIVDTILTKEGSAENLLPDFLRLPTTGWIAGLNSEGMLIGQRWTGSDQTPFYLDLDTGRMQGLKGLPGEESSGLQVYSINNYGQIVGTQNAKAIFYSSPDAMPVELSKLLTEPTDWDLTRATGINNRGEIVAYGYRGGIESGVFKLSPESTVPEPSSIAMFAIIGVALAYRTAKSPRSIWHGNLREQWEGSTNRKKDLNDQVQPECQIRMGYLIVPTSGLEGPELLRSSC